MFTGLVQDMGTVLWLRATETATQLTLRTAKLGRTARLGESIAVNGCCLTVTARRDETLTFDLLKETLERTNLGGLRPGAAVNLEAALRVGDTLGGHFVQGHIDCRSSVFSVMPKGTDLRLEVVVPPDFSHYVAYKGSIAINGVSLTIAEFTERTVVCWLIPHTRENTNLGALQEGDAVNLEFDILAKYVERIRCVHA
jgi:riboflavin synthase